jgi:putative oxidoreductase
MKAKDVAVRVLRWILGLFFVADGLIKLTGISRTVLLFERIGWGQWFRYFSGGLVLVGGLLILLRLRLTFLGSILCGCTGALLYALKLHRDPTLPATLTLLTVTLAVLTYSHQRQLRAAKGGQEGRARGDPAADAADGAR